MTESDFLLLSIERWPLFVALVVFFLGLTFVSVQRVAVGGIFDPAVVIFTANYSVNYAVVIFLYVIGEMQGRYLAVIIAYGIVLIQTFRISSSTRIKSSLFSYISVITPKRLGRRAFQISVLCYALLSVVVISKMGLGVFVEENRFEAARGLGIFIRIMDSLAPFVTAFWTVLIVQKRRKRVLSIVALILFVIFASMVNGAKIAVIYLFVTALLALRMTKPRMALPPVKTTLALVFGVGFVLFALHMNLEKNKVEQDVNSPLAGTSLVLERLIFRIIANGNTSYLLLPNRVIEGIATDNIIVRFAEPLMGSSYLSSLLGYTVSDFSVGRQALLHYDPTETVAGGPTSHFDLFAYVYLGVSGGLIFVIGMGYLLGAVNRCVWLSRRESAMRVNPFRIALVATLWSRAILMILEPTVAFAYIIDLLLIFSVMSFVLTAMSRTSMSEDREWVAR